MRTITVHVTSEDIKAGRRGRCQLCPVALALERALQTPVSVGMAAWDTMEASNQRLPLALKLASRRFSLPVSAQLFVERFDEELRVQPFSFEVTVPDSLELSSACT